MEVCKLFNRCVYFLVRKSLRDVKNIDPFALLRIVATWGGRACLALFAGVLLVVTWVVIFAMIPSEWRSSDDKSWFFTRIPLLVYVYYSVVFHYYKARTLEPVKNPGVPGDRFCVPCNNWKGEFTMHCKGCDKCIYRLDHHCPHVGQCVGAHNQAHFFLFLFWLLIATALFFLAAPDFWWNWVQIHEDEVDPWAASCWRPFCFNQFVYIVMRKWGRFLSIPTRGLDSAVKFCAFLFVMLHFVMWGFVCSYSYTISCGVTMAMKMFQTTDEVPPMRFSWLTLKIRWRRYFNCRREPLWKVFLVPRSRPIVIYKEYKEMLL